ncbi:MAG: hypothetical protein D6725_00050 [Planctomycetota bacterium]|nr:MAG: hypothetical protein D6725_00050 [Planctomycetota bacterium]
MEWVTLFIIILILGALAGGDSFGESVRRGCGCLIWIMIALFILAAIGTNARRRDGGPPPREAPERPVGPGPVRKPRRGDDSEGLEVRACFPRRGLPTVSVVRIGGPRHLPSRPRVPGIDAV